MDVRQRERRSSKLFMGVVLSVGMLTGAWVTLAAEDQPGSAPAGTPAQQGSNSLKDSNRSAAPPSFQQRRPRYQLEPGDTLELDFAFSPEFNQTVPVQPDGYITLRGVGDLYVRGKTLPELRESLRGAYGTFLHDPVITVDVKDFQKPYFVAGGEVTRPGKYDLRDNTTVTEAVAIAGGLTKGSKDSQVVLFRRVSDTMVETKQLNLKKMLASRDLREDLYLRPGDMLYVPKNKLAKIGRLIPTSSLSLYFNPLSWW